jgi:hypothetical protein
VKDGDEMITQELLVIFTAVNEVRFRSIARTLAEAQDVPGWFVDLEYINWHGTYKDLSLAMMPQPKYTNV